jgi:hypothetical protein
VIVVMRRGDHRRIAAEPAAEFARHAHAGVDALRAEGRYIGRPQ